MKKYRAYVSYRLPHVTFIGVEATNEEAAKAAALELAENNYDDYTWEECEEDPFEVNHVEEIGPPEAA